MPCLSQLFQGARVRLRTVTKHEQAELGDYAQEVGKVFQKRVPFHEVIYSSSFTNKINR